MKAIIISAILIFHQTTFAQWYGVHRDTEKDLFSIDFISEDTGFIGGEGVFATSTDGGRYWLTINNFSGYHVLGLDFLNETHGVAVGRFSDPGSGFIYYTTNSGINWNKGYFGSFAGLNDVFLLDSVHGWAVGNYGNIFKMVSRIDHWEYVSSANTDLKAVYFINQNVGWAVGYGKCIKTTDGGNTWFEQQTGVNSMFRDVYFLDEYRGWITAANTELLHTTDGGNTWTVTTLPTLVGNIQFLSDSLGFISGSGHVLKTTDGGNTWSDYIIPNSAWIFSIKFIDENIGYFVGGYNKLFKTTDGGVNWFPMMLGEFNKLNSIHMFNESNGVAVGNEGTILRTLSGNVWFSAFSNTYNKLNSVFTLNNNSAIAVGDSGIILKATDTYFNWIEKSSGVITNLNCVIFVNNDLGWIAGNEGIILKSTNGGETWELLNSGTTMNLNSISFSNHLNGWAAGNGGVIKTTDGGVNWFQQNIINNNYYCIQLLDSYEGFVLGQNGKLFRTYDGGLNWELVHTNQYSLYSISFYNMWIGWSCGQFGRINHTLHIGTLWNVQFQYPSINFNSINAVDDQVCYAAGDKGLIFRTKNGGTPVELISFLGFQGNGKVYLNWQTETELNNLMFEVQRKVEDTDWLTIGYKPGAGTTTELQHYEYIDDCYGIPGGSNLLYRLKQVDFNGNYKYSNEISIDKLALKEHTLNQNYPNPFNPSTSISYSIPLQSLVEIKVYDILGRNIKTLVNEEKPAGAYLIEFNADGITSGIYFYTLKAGSFIQTKKMILIK